VHFYRVDGVFMKFAEVAEKMAKLFDAIASHTAVDGSDPDIFFKQLFDWLDTPPNERN